jgi:UDP-N-acetyl-D-mannosaminuronic acid dehydrogenase
MHTKETLERIRRRESSIAVLGAGYVGLTTATLLANAGFKVMAVDIKDKIVKTINRGACPIKEPELGALLKLNVDAGRLRATLNASEALQWADVTIICVQTPIGRYKEPDLSFLMDALRNVGKNLKKEMIVIISSTVPPKTIREIARTMLESLSNLKTEKDFYLAYVPERVAPGNVIKEFIEGPRIVGGIGSNSSRVVAELFRTVCKNVIETDDAIAEVAKLAENIFRDVNIAFANELALICEKLGVDVINVIKIANTHPRVNIHQPGPGVGGPCLPKDPYLLVHGAKVKGAGSKIILASRRLNDYMPLHIVQKVIKGLTLTGKHIEKSKICILGTAYKGGVSDSRLSPSKKVIQQILKLGGEVTVYDPYCKENFGAKAAETLSAAAKGVDCIVVMTDHPEFKKLDLSMLKNLMNEKPIIVDGKRILDPTEAKKFNFTYIGVGYV